MNLEIPWGIDEIVWFYQGFVFSPLCSCCGQKDQTKAIYKNVVKTGIITHINIWIHKLRGISNNIIVITVKTESEGTVSFESKYVYKTKEEAEKAAGLI